MIKKIPKLLIIAGSDPSGGAGIQTDIKVATSHKVYASAVITCLTAQNTKKVFAIHNPPISFLKAQLDAVLDDISFDAIKIGMLGNAEIIEVVAKILAKKALKTKIILDPVMVATSGDILLENDAIQALNKFAKQAFLITPNVDEAEILADMKIKNVADMKIAASKIQKIGAKNVFIKGGHLKMENLDKKSKIVGAKIKTQIKTQKITNILLNEKGDFFEITNNKIAVKNIHGTGCALASAISCNLACKKSLLKSVKNANNYIYQQILQNAKIGNGSLVLKHF